MKYGQYSREELEKMEKSKVRLCDRNLDGLLFGYATFNAGCASLGEYGGFSLLLSEEGTVEVREYLFPEILVEERFYSVPQSCISEIRWQYWKYHDEIPKMDAPDNGSCDGSYDCFYFGDRWINALNIDYSDAKAIRRIRKVHPNDFEEVMEIVRKENEIMKFFFSICKILRKYGVNLEQYSVTIDGKKTTGYSEFYTDYYNCD